VTVRRLLHRGLGGRTFFGTTVAGLADQADLDFADALPSTGQDDEEAVMGNALRTSALIAALGLVAALALPGVAAGAPKASPTFQDSARGTGSTPAFTNFDFDVRSGPSGENPTGVSSTDGFGEHFEATSVDCLAVDGNTATFAGPLKPNTFGFNFGKVTVVDNGPENSGLDLYAANGFVLPTDCAFPAAGFLAPLTSGDVVVVDSPPPPNSKEQCKHGGYARYGFKNQGRCVAFVEP
jgi:hypothetical protein